MGIVFPSALAQTAWDIDIAHSSLVFSIRHLVISTVQGRFDRWYGTLVHDAGHLERSQVEIRIETSSINTNDAKRDAHLCSAEFFDAAKYPEITFRSTRMRREDADRFQMAGDLTIAGVTLSVLLQTETLGFATDPWGGERAVFSARTTIDRRDFGLAWNQTLEAGGLLIGEKVEVAIVVEAVKRAVPMAKQA